MIFLLIAVFTGIVLYEVPGLIRNKYWYELGVFSFLLAIAFVISLLYSLNIKVPNPVKETQYIVKYLLHLSYD
jgi:hypothetical protein